LVALTFTAAVFAPVAVGAQIISPTNAPESPATATPRNGAAQLTGKERLGEKWKDEQRVDNCNVPLDKRGTKPRPDSCEHTPSRSYRRPGQRTRKSVRVTAASPLFGLSRGTITDGRGLWLALWRTSIWCPHDQALSRSRTAIVLGNSAAQPKLSESK
jgi:hypothetical protein